MLRNWREDSESRVQATTNPRSLRGLSSPSVCSGDRWSLTNTRMPVGIYASSSSCFEPGARKVRMTKRAKRLSSNRLRRRHSYTMSELAERLGVHVRTVQSWHKQGMDAIDESDRPLLFLGSSAVEFLRKRHVARRCPLGPGQFYCVRCQDARWPKKDSVEFRFTRRRMGRNDEQILIKAICKKCGCTLTLFGTRRSLLAGYWREQFQQAERRLYGKGKHSLNTDSERCGDNES